MIKLRPMLDDVYIYYDKNVENSFLENYGFDNEALLPLNFEVYSFIQNDEGELIEEGKIGNVTGFIVRKWYDLECYIDEFDKISDYAIEFYEYLAEENEDILGEIKCDQMSFEEDLYYIERMEINSEYRSKGVGSSIFKFIHEYLSMYMCLEIYGVFLFAGITEDLNQGDSKARNKRLVNYYERNGFIKIGERPFAQLMFKKT